MSSFETARLPAGRSETAPDGSAVRWLLRLPAASMVHVELPAGETSAAVTHRTVEEVWYVVSGRGEMWRRQGEREETIVLEPGTCLSIPLGTHFQFRASSAEPVSAIVMTAPPWPGEGEAVPVAGPWKPSGR